MINHLMALATRVTLGKEMALAVVLLQLITEAIRKKDIKNVAIFVYRKLPAAWRHPKGPATEEEFVALIESGEVFMRNLQALHTR